MDLSNLTRQEIISLRNKCNRALQAFDKRERCKIFVISDTEGDSQYCFKHPEDAINHLDDMLSRESENHELFKEGSKTILSINYIDKVEYDQQSDSWIEL